jgi:predicted nuclease of predicted toxin-antitoxin system
VNFLIDNPLSPHVADYGMQAALDEAILDRAAEEARIVVSADTDFGALLALGERTAPSVMIFRGASPKRAEAQVALMVASLPAIASALVRGAIVILEHHRLRVRDLPISRPADEPA